MHLRKVKDVEEKIKEYSDVVVFNPESNKGKWHDLFKNNNPIYLEIGMGKGKFIREHARRNPDINYIGCELSTSMCYKSAKEVDNLNNLKIINYDAFKLEDVFESGEIDKIYLTFSDPWPKARHEKRRLTTDNVLNIYKKLLSNDGIIEFKTDNRELFEYSVIQFTNNNFEILELSLDLHKTSDDIITTEYEEKFMAKGQVIYFIKVKERNV